ncbi:MAG: NAD(P)-binding protein [Parasphingorhabdus sp.]|uniref:NAD(P)-binding protein n=1 Tax=Parasphingorhabdus sp. TaxID=2709688 RepID=UPI0032984493
MKIAIIGSGLSGLACADQLRTAGHQLFLFDKARGPGGRMSTRRIESAAGDISFDHGAQYFTAHDPSFQIVVDGWGKLGVASRWPVLQSSQMPLFCQPSHARFIVRI